MCKQCTKFVNAAIKSGATRETATNILWNHTAFPFEHPTEKQIEKISKYPFKKYGTQGF